MVDQVFHFPRIRVDDEGNEFEDGAEYCSKDAVSEPVPDEFHFLRMPEGDFPCIRFLRKPLTGCKWDDDFALPDGSPPDYGKWIPVAGQEEFVIKDEQLQNFSVNQNSSFMCTIYSRGDFSADFTLEIDLFFLTLGGTYCDFGLWFHDPILDEFFSFDLDIYDNGGSYSYYIRHYTAPYFTNYINILRPTNDHVKLKVQRIGDDFSFWYDSTGGGYVFASTLDTSGYGQGANFSQLGPYARNTDNVNPYDMRLDNFTVVDGCPP